MQRESHQRLIQRLMWCTTTGEMLVLFRHNLRIQICREGPNKSSRSLDNLGRAISTEQAERQFAKLKKLSSPEKGFCAFREK